ncbi:Cro/CI family transcriptional regulator [Snodgrassella alvi]|uniref:Cro/CI family transcriptional regulator n=1 Tax=Snodgrassella alvi TaxID=1196083 RepID=UPI0015D536CC|nr:Cro/CI family transcriptional regulator [Snodgrassella alvi]
MINKDSEFIDALGGVSKVAKICGITKGAVSQWRKKGIPKAQLNYLKILHIKTYMNIFHMRKQ